MAADETKKSQLRAIEARVERLFSRLKRIHDSALALDIKEKYDEIISISIKIDEDSCKFESELDKFIDLATELEPTQTETLKKRYHQLGNSYDEMYNKSKIRLIQCGKIEKEKSVEVRNVNLSVKLPKIELKQFSGSLKDWPVFYESFRTLVHGNKGIDDAAKFHYLISSLSGPPLSFANNLPINSENYQIVWKSLVERYQNKRILGTNLLDSICEFPALKDASCDSINKLLSTINDATSSILTLKIKDLSDFTLLYLALKKLPPFLRRQFETHNVDEDVPTIKDLIKFLRQQSKIAELSQATPASVTKFSSSPSTPTSHHKVFVSNESPSFTRKCSHCQGDHWVRNCESFKKLSTEEKRAIVIEHNLCFNCLGKNHRALQCSSTVKCQKCNKSHHTMLHALLVSSDVGGPSETSVAAQPVIATRTLAAQNKPLTSNASQVLLGTAVIKIKDGQGIWQSVRAVIDSASMSSFITFSCAKRLKLNVENRPTNISGLGDQTVSTSGLTAISMKPRQTETPILSTDAIVVPTITAKLPSSFVPPEIQVEWKKLDLADPHFGDPANIDILIGVELYPHIQNSHKIITDDLCGLHSIFGWVIMGKSPAISESPSKSSLLTLNNSALNASLTKFWEIEEVPDHNHIDPEDELCEEMFKKLHYRDDTGRYVVPLMLKTDNPVFSGSFSLAKNRLITLENRLRKNHQLKDSYATFLKEYADLGHMTKVTYGIAAYYIPHQAVINVNSKSTKIRVVFDASMVTSVGSSLNSILYKGPKLQKDIIDVLFKFRIHAIVLTADICKMYRQILIRPEDRKYQHILWRDNEQQAIEEYELNTVTYGTTSAPYLALRTVDQLRIDEGEHFPKASEVLKNNVYVDDILAGADTLTEAEIIRDETIGIFEKGKFELRKWSSNRPELLTKFADFQLAEPLLFHPDSQVKLSALGIKWDPISDTFSFNSSEIDSTCTKRSILSNVAKIYDPLGWISPIVFIVKCLIQQLWLLGLDWDSPVPNEVRNQWSTWASQINQVSSIKMPRYTFCPEMEKTQVIGFCDASEKGYGACVYVQVTGKDSEIKTHLLISKAKVAPLKTLSIPRLELCGAVVLAKLLSYVKRFYTSCNIPVEKYLALSDSTTVLNWITTPPYQLTTFVANRVAGILENVEPELWAHIPTKENPADFLSRGLFPSQLVNNPMWWEGPTWLKNSDMSSWPLTKITSVPKEKVLELKSKVISCVAQTTLPDQLVAFERYYQKYQRTKKSPKCFRLTTKTNRINLYPSDILRILKSLKP